jgi:hypothetical protein
MKDCDNSDILDKKREQARESYKRQEKRDEQTNIDSYDNLTIGNTSIG